MNGLVFDDDTNLLRIDVKGRAAARETEAQNLYPELFPYSEVPRVAFGTGEIPMRMADEIFITDTTFRDGQQARAPFTAEQVRDLYALLHELGGPKGIVRQCEFFVYTAEDRRALALCRGLGFRFPEITSWIRATPEDFALLHDLQIGETGILTSCSDYHIFHKLRLTRAEAMEKYLAVVKMALASGIKPRCHLEDITRADIPGFVLPFARELMKLSREAGVPIKIRCCDTLGLGVPYPGAALPRSVPAIVHLLKTEAGVPGAQLEWHGHNDFHKGVVNAAAAWLYGAASVNCCLLGIGERTGNVPLEAMAMEYCQLRGASDGLNLPALTKIAEYFKKEIGYAIPPQTPFVGDDFCTTRAGVHADGLMKDERIYSIFDTRELLGRENEVVVDARCGLAGVAYWINRHFKLNLDKSSPVVHAVKQAVDAQYLTGRTGAMSAEELTRMTNAALRAGLGQTDAG